jgi:hypothetical protein
MENEKLESMLIDYIEGRLNEVDKRKVEDELIKNPEAYKTYDQLKEVMLVMDATKMREPSEELKVSFHQLLQNEINNSKTTKTVFFSPTFYRVAAAVAFFAIVGTIGYLVRQHQVREAEVAALREEMQKTRELIVDKLNNDLSASQRIQGVNVALTVDKADDEIVGALVKAMNEDPNTNVRLAALEALSKFHDEPTVRKALVQSLPKQKDPVIQIALIQLMVRMKEKTIIKDLERIIEDEKSLEAVKNEAHSGILKLS